MQFLSEYLKTTGLYTQWIETSWRKPSVNLFLTSVWQFTTEINWMYCRWIGQNAHYRVSMFSIKMPKNHAFPKDPTTRASASLVSFRYDVRFKLNLMEKRLYFGKLVAYIHLRSQFLNRVVIGFSLDCYYGLIKVIYFVLAIVWDWSLFRQVLWRTNDSSEWSFNES